MRLLRVPVSGLVAGRFELPEASGRYVARVLRRGSGDTLLLFDGGAKLEALATIVEASGSRVLVEAGELKTAQVAGERKITLAQAVGKGDKLDQVVRDATELGATVIVPLLTRRTVVQPGPKAGAKAERWRKIAVEAARQSGRGDTPEVGEITSLDRAAVEIEADVKIALTPQAPTRAGSLLLACPAEASIALLVGPEGGLDQGELDRLEGAGWHLASLGPRVLRTETVAAAVLGGLLLLEVAEPARGH